MSMTIEVYVRSQADESLAAYFSNHVSGGAAIHELQYTLSRIGGCCEIELTASRERAQGHSVSVGNLIEVYTKSDDEERGCRYRGMILSVDEDYVKDTVTVKGWGFWAQFEWAIPTQYIEETDVESVVDAIFDNIKAQTYCETAGSTVLASSATIGDIELEYQSAADIIKKLAEFQADVDYGVDEDGTFYFEDKTTTKRGHFQVGLNVADLTVSETMEELYNDVLIKTKGAVSNGSLILHEDDTTSIASYKKRTKVIDAPEFADLADSVTWGTGQVDDNKAPAKVYDFTPIISAQKHFPYRGTVELVDRDGTSLVTADIESVEYSYEGEAGFSQSLEIGDARAKKDAGRMLAELDRKVIALKASEISSTKIEHSAYDEFAQTVLKDAHANDKYNVLMVDGSGYGSGRMKTVEYYTNADIWRLQGAMASTLFGLRGRFREESELSLIQSLEIPVGRAVDLVRIYYHMDQWGRYNFADEDALQDWYNISCSDGSLGGYIIEHDTVNDISNLVGNPVLSEANRGDLRLRPLNWTTEYIGDNAERAYYQQPDNGYVRFLVYADGNTSDIPFYCKFNYNRSSNNYALFYITIGASSIDFNVQRFEAGAWVSTSSTISDNLSSGAYIVKLEIDADANLVKAHIYIASSEVLVGTCQVSMAEQSDKTFSITKMGNSDNVSETSDAQLRWFDFPLEDGGTERVTLKVSRDGGANWVSDTPAHVRGEGHVDIDLSAQSSVNKTLMLRVESTWPAVIYGLAMAWGGD